MTHPSAGIADFRLVGGRSAGRLRRSGLLLGLRLWPRRRWLVNVRRLGRWRRLGGLELFAGERPRLPRDRWRCLVHGGGRTPVYAGVELIAADNRDARGNDIAVSPSEPLRRDRSSLLRQWEYR